jgi:hypothetical protein
MAVIPSRLATKTIGALIPMRGLGVLRRCRTSVKSCLLGGGSHGLSSFVVDQELFGIDCAKPHDRLSTDRSKRFLVFDFLRRLGQRGTHVDR